MLCVGKELYVRFICDDAYDVSYGAYATRMIS